MKHRSPSRDRLRRTFEEVPELYDQARPVYPDQVFDDLTALAEIPPGGRVLEIGCGTAKATLPLARRGFEITCVELGKGLAEVARRKLQAFPKAEVITGNFETWEPARTNFDAVVAFTAFHWIDPQLRYQKPALLLRDKGSLVVVATRHVKRQQLYDRIRRRVAAAPGAKVTKTYLATLNVARPRRPKVEGLRTG